jgi:hypothetical protein
LEATRRDTQPSAGQRRSKVKKASVKEGKKSAKEIDESTESKGEIPQNSERLESATNLGLFPGEDHAAYAALHDELKKLHRPETPLHVEVVARATALIWRLRRIPAFEAAVFNSTARSLGCLTQLSSSKRSPEEQSANFGHVLSDVLKADALSKIAQYEAMLRDQLKLVYKELEEILDWHFRFDLERGSIDFVREDAPADPPWLIK